jgi:hypothetical protein
LGFEDHYSQNKTKMHYMGYIGCLLVGLLISICGAVFAASVTMLTGSNIPFWTNSFGDAIWCLSIIFFCGGFGYTMHCYSVERRPGYGPVVGCNGFIALFVSELVTACNISGTQNWFFVIGVLSFSVAGMFEEIAQMRIHNVALDIILPTKLVLVRIKIMWIAIVSCVLGSLLCEPLLHYLIPILTIYTEIKEPMAAVAVVGGATAGFVACLCVTKIQDDLEKNTAPPAADSIIRSLRP